MRTPALTAALADIDTAFDGCTSPGETGCGRCHLPEETAYLRTPSVRVPLDVVKMYLCEVSDHFDDQAAAMRRLLPDAARAMADGTLDGLGWETQALSGAERRSWSAEQVSALEAFVLVWWQEVLTVPEPPYPVEDVFEVCAKILRTMTPLLDRWEPGPVADTHLVGCADTWLYDLVGDQWPFRWWDPDDEAAAIAELQCWLARHAAGRLRDRGETDLAKRAELVGLPYDERWNDRYWASPSATN
ncbi:hypothetical protein ACIHEJ_22235 [Streptomyces sp. NPDC052301]|uniref:hypothetical protein n=1 Tax=Streptomyces sp. NPDC052301 TaxID=3365687 RepID=UPI0037CFF7FE